MRQKHLGTILIVIGILLGIFVTTMSIQEDKYIETIIDSQDGSCFIDDGTTCLHGDRNYTPYILGYVLAVGLLLFGTYLLFFDKTEEDLMNHQKHITSALKEAKNTDSKKERFNAFLAGFDEDKKKILLAINEQEGIQQSTLRYRTGLTKSTLSLQLKELEQKEIISRKPEGKTNKVYLRKKF